MAVSLPSENRILSEEVVNKNGWLFPADIFSLLSPYEKSFIDIEFDGFRTLQYYQNRLTSLGFTNMDSVLDAACGMGQWSIALSRLNGFVEGGDINTARLFIAEALSRTMNVANARYSNQNLEKLAFPEKSFSGVFCYGSFMFTHMTLALREFYRVLKPGGLVYLNANSFGWYAHSLIDRGLRSRDIRRFVGDLRILTRTILGFDKHILVRRSWLLDKMKKEGFEIVSSGLEGEIALETNIPKVQSAYPSHYYGLPAILEVVGRKI